MSDLPSSEQLLALRYRLVNCDVGDLDVHEHQLATIRRNLPRSAPSAIPLRAAFRAVWAELQKDDRLWCYVPPIYADEGLQKVLDAIIDALWHRECGRIKNSTENVGHVVLGGVEGTGKTTLLRAVLLGVAVLLTVMVPVTHTCSCDTAVAPAILLHAAADALHGPAEDADTADEKPHIHALDRLRSGGHELLLVLDEFQNVFSLSAAALPARVRVAWQVHDLSRRYGTYGLLAGSSSDMRTCMFRSGTVLSPDPLRAAGFPDFNGSLYNMHEVAALRTVPALQAYLQQRYPTWKVTQHDVGDILYWTGGIGRIVDEFWLATLAGRGDVIVGSTAVAGAAAMSSTAHAPDDAAGSSANEVAATVAPSSLLRNRDGHRRMTPSKALEDRAGRVVITAILAAHYPDVVDDSARESSHTLRCIGISRSQAKGTLEVMEIASPDAELRRLVDFSVLYDNVETGTVELARPSDAHEYLSEVSPNPSATVMLTAVAMMMRGISCGKLDDDDAPLIHVNAGFALESLVRPLVHTHMAAGSLRGITACYGWQCKIVGGGLHVAPPTSAAFARLTTEMLPKINGQMLRWRKETGLDGVILVKRTEAADWQLHGWQCKGGHSAVPITGGSIARSVSQFVKDTTVSGLNDSTSHGIMVKAQVGMCTLLLAWHAALGATAPRLVPASLLITTTKDARLAKEAIESAKHCMKLDRKVAGTVGVTRTMAWAETALASVIRVTLLDGADGWLTDCVPREVKPLARLWIPVRPPAEAAHRASRGCIVM